MIRVRRCILRVWGTFDRVWIDELFRASLADTAEKAGAGLNYVVKTLAPQLERCYTGCTQPEQQMFFLRNADNDQQYWIADFREWGSRSHATPFSSIDEANDVGELDIDSGEFVIVQGW